MDQRRNNSTERNNSKHSGFMFFDVIFGIVSFALTLAMSIVGVVFSVLGAVLGGRSAKQPVNVNMNQSCCNKASADAPNKAHKDNARYGNLNSFNNDGTTASSSKAESEPNKNNTTYYNQRRDYDIPKQQGKKTAADQKKQQSKESAENASGNASDLNILIFVFTLIPVIIFLAMKELMLAGAAAVTGVGLMIIYNSIRSIFKPKSKSAKANTEEKTTASEDTETEKLIKEAFDKVFLIRKNLYKVTNQSIRDKVESLCSMAEKIIGEVRTNPENLKVVKKFFYYYLDAFNEIYNRYLRIAAFNNSSEEIDKTIAETEKAFDDVENIFKELCESLIENDMLNIKATINVMKNS